jgi:ATP-dependent exoDNAse (exonuclease V) beta subunit
MRTATASEHEIPYVWVSDTGRHVGSVVHELLNRVGREGLTRWNSERITALAPLITSELKRVGVASAAQAAASSTVVRALQKTLESERGQWILQSRRDAQSEWPVAGLVGDRLISGTIDRMFQDEEGRLWSVDFKTSEHEGGRVEHFLDKEQQRYREQLESYGALMSRLTQGPIWLGLYFPLLDGWREWQLETEAAVTADYTEV